jgi:hypothetical protein
MQRIWCAVVLVALLVPGSQGDPADRHTPFDRILDTFVRDGYVYYKALKASRAPLDQYVISLDIAPDELARMTDNDRRAFWLNAYNALVIRTVINAYPIRPIPPRALGSCRVRSTRSSIAWPAGCYRWMKSKI